MPRSRLERRALPQAGIYVLLTELPTSRRLRVRQRGRRLFTAGWYCYVGSAQRGLPARLRRHARRRKVRRWHIDALTRAARVLGAWVAEAPRPWECRLAACLSRRGEVVVGFGASDCRCPGHLAGFGSRRRAAAAVAACWRELGEPGAVVGKELTWWSESRFGAKIFGKKG